MLVVWLMVVLAYGSLQPLTASADVAPASVAERLIVERRRVSIDGLAVTAQVARIPLAAYRMMPRRRFLPSKDSHVVPTA